MVDTREISNKMDSGELASIKIKGTKQVATLDDIISAEEGFVKADGTVPMVDAYVPTVDKSIATKDYVDANVTSPSTDHTTLTNLNTVNQHGIPVITGLQPALDAKEDSVVGKELSDENYTTAEKAKLAGLDAPTYKGHFESATALEAAYPAASQAAGDSADVTVGAEIHRFIIVGAAWVDQGVTGADSAAEIKNKYESNADTECFNTGEQDKLLNIEVGATADQAASEFNHDDLNAVDPDEHFTQAQITIPTTQIDGFDASVRTAIENTDHNNLSGRLHVPDGAINTHDIGAITGLQPALDGKVDVVGGQRWIYMSNFATPHAAIAYAEDTANYIDGSPLCVWVDGLFTLNSVLEITKSDYTIRGLGNPYSCGFVASAGLTGNMLRVRGVPGGSGSDNFIRVEELRLENFLIKGRFGITYGIRLNKSQWVFMIGLRLENHHTGIKIDNPADTDDDRKGSFDWLIDRCFIKSWQGSAINVDYLGHASTISNCRLQTGMFGEASPPGDPLNIGNAYGSNVYKHHTSGLSIVNNRIETQDLGVGSNNLIQLHSVRGCHIAGNYMEDHGVNSTNSRGIKIGDYAGSGSPYNHECNGVAVVGNHIVYTGGGAGGNSPNWAFDLINVEGCFIAGNFCKNWSAIYRRGAATSTTYLTVDKSNYFYA